MNEARSDEVKEKLKKDPSTLTFLLEELSKCRIDVDKESAKDFAYSDLKTKLTIEIVTCYISTFVFISIGIIMLLIPILSLQKPGFLERFYNMYFDEKVLVVVGSLFYLAFFTGFILVGVIGLVNVRKLHKALKSIQKAIN